MNTWETQYLKLLECIIHEGERRTGRNGDTVSIFAPEYFRIDLAQEFPLVTTRKINWAFCRDELLWFLSGSCNIDDASLVVQGIWESWTQGALDHSIKSPFVEDREIGISYGKILRGEHHNDVDQLGMLVKGLRDDPTSRRHLISTWQANAMAHQIEYGLLTVCHGAAIQAYVREGRYLDLFSYQRSADVPVGVPYNVASYALFVHMVAAQVGLQPGRLTYGFGDAHIYVNQLALVGEQLERTPRNPPRLKLDGVSAFKPQVRRGRALTPWPYGPDHIHLEDYHHHHHLPYPVSV